MFNFYLLFLWLNILTLTGGPAATVTSEPPSPDLTAYPWLYQRHNTPLAADEAVAELIAVGDVMLGRGVAPEPAPLAQVAPWLNAADLSFGNLETVIRTEQALHPDYDAKPGQQPYRLSAPLSAIDHLQAAGFDLLSLANNHALDYGADGLSETVSHLSRVGITPLGANPGATSATQPVLRQVGEVRLAFLAFNAVATPEDGLVDRTSWHPARWDPNPALAAIRDARTQAEAVIVSIHWGYEYNLQVDPAQRAIAQSMLAAGADLILGHHPHVVQAVEVVGQDKLVAYSLGNFVFDQGFYETGQGVALRAFFDRQGLRAVQALPVWAGPTPRLMTPSEAEPLLTRLQPTPVRLGFRCTPQTCQPVDEVPAIVGSGIFWGGQIDLTGDGIPEKVRRSGKQIFFYRDGAEIWRSDVDWQVTDLALGDPNDDGRGEVLLALWKPDERGNLRSHPFIIGYRRGIYRDIWGGSAVATPIYEVELGDIDNDDVEELMVLEQAGAGELRTLSVWDWHGWGFSLLWRSAPGNYRGLVYSPATDVQPPLVSVSVIKP